MYRLELTKTIGVGEEVLHGESPGMVHPHGTVHELDPTGIYGLKNCVEFGDIEANGLLEEEVLTLVGGEDGPVEVEAGGERDVDGVDVGIVEEGFVGAVDFCVGREAIGRREGLRLVDAAAGHGGEGGVRGLADGARQLAGDLGAAEDSDPDWGFDRHC